MHGDQLRDLARRAANQTGYRQILVLGSQAVHGALPGADLPAITTMSEEADLAVVNDLSGETPHVIEAAFGMGSPYHQSFGVYADGIALSEVALPDGWQGRVRTEQIGDGADVGGSPEVTDSREVGTLVTNRTEETMGKVYPEELKRKAVELYRLDEATTCAPRS